MRSPAVPAEAAAISALAIGSKAHWGYDRAAMEIFRTELTLRPEEFEPRRADPRGRRRDSGVYTIAEAHLSMLELDNETLELEHLHVLKDELRLGLGSSLLAHAIGTATQLGAKRLVIQSDPRAEGFYRKGSARILRRIKTSIPGRTLPLMELTIG